MPVPLTPKRKFIKWFVRPFNEMKRVRTGDAAFAALAMGFQLCERYFRIKSNTINKYRDYKFLHPAARAYKVDEDFFRDFWHLYRHGLLHQGAPKRKVEVRGTKKGQPKKYRRYKWGVTGELKRAAPFLGRRKNTKTIFVNPWEFTAFMLRMFLRHPNELKKSISHAFGNISPLSDDYRLQEKPYKVRWRDLP